MRTPISYYGGKQAMLNHILPRIPAHTVYTEVFFGGGAVFFSKKQSHNETINDKLDIVVNFYEVLKLRFDELKPMVEATLISRTVHNRALNTIRAHKKWSKGQTKRKVCPVKLAWAFWVCTNFAFSNKIGGGYKYSNNQDTVVSDTLRIKKLEFDNALSKRIQRTYIENTDFLKVLRSRNTKDAFHYLDPPYYNADMGHYGDWNIDDYERLLFWCQDECKGKFMLSSYKSDILQEFVDRNGWRSIEVTKRIQANMKTLSPRDKTEVLAWNYDEGHGQTTIFDHIENSEK